MRHKISWLNMTLFTISPPKIGTVWDRHEFSMVGAVTNVPCYLLIVLFLSGGRILFPSPLNLSVAMQRALTNEMWAEVMYVVFRQQLLKAKVWFSLLFSCCGGPHGSMDWVEDAIGSRHPGILRHCKEDSCRVLCMIKM